MAQTVNGWLRRGCLPQDEEAQPARVGTGREVGEAGFGDQVVEASAARWALDVALRQRVFLEVQSLRGGPQGGGREVVEDSGAVP